MKKTLAVIAGEPNSISSEIIFKCWKLKRKFNHHNFFVIGNINILNKQKKKLKYNIPIKKINFKFDVSDLNKNYLPVFNIKYQQKRAFEKISNKSSKYILESFNAAINFIKKNKIQGLINCPISKEFLLGNKYAGITEFLSKKLGASGKEVMLIFNKKLSVSPLTTHIPLNKVSGQISKKKLVEKIKTIDTFYKKKLKKKPTIGVLGFNPHNYSNSKKSEERQFIIPAIKTLKKRGLKIVGPISPDSSFMVYRKHKLNVIIGMYHDQVLTAYKCLFGYNSVNVTLGLPFFRVSPDHGVAEDIMGRNIANPVSLIESLKFFNYFK